MTPLILLLAPAALAAAAAFAFSGPAFRPAATLRRAEAAALAALAVAALAAVLLVAAGPATGPAIGIGHLAFASRLDVVSVTMLLLVAAIGWVVLRYSATYLDGEPRQGAFTGWMCLTIACVMLLVQAGTLAQLLVPWTATSLCLHRLLLFYPERPGARRAARKKFLTARAGDLALLGAAVLLARAYGTGDIAAILAAANAGAAPAGAPWAAGLIAIAALLKSAQFPFHGWLTEVMETPTPVSALLHAGVINAGGFLLIRFADVMLLAPGALAGLAMVGGFTALFGGLVMLTQPAVKTALAWSTVAQMGFMILQCGLALWPLALLHIVAHSFYKAHAFLASGGAVEAVALIPRPGPVAIPGRAAVGRAFLVALAVYATAALAIGPVSASPQAAALGAILVFGVAYLIAQGMADAAPRALTLRTGLAALATALGYFALQAGAGAVTAGALPPAPAPGPLEWALIALALMSFGLVALAQAMLPLWADHPAASVLRVHLANGLYANALFDRLTGGWSRQGAA